MHRPRLQLAEVPSWRTLAQRPLPAIATRGVHYRGSKTPVGHYYGTSRHSLRALGLHCLDLAFAAQRCASIGYWAWSGGPPLSCTG